MGRMDRVNRVNRVATLLTVAALLAGSACARGESDEQLSEMSVEPVGAASIEVIRGDEVLEIAEAVDLEVGDLVVTGEGQQARLRLEGARNVWIAPSTKVLVADGRTVEARGGSILVDAEETTVALLGDTSATATNGVFRIDRRVATARAASYRGEVTLSSPGEARVEVAALYQVSIAAGDIARPKPYKVELDDPWDGQWLESVVALEDDIARLASGFSNQRGKSRLRLEYFRELAGRGVGFMRDHMRRPPAEIFIGYAIADRTPRVGLGPAFKRAFALREEGGSWGVVAAIMGVESRPLVASLEDLFLGTGVIASTSSNGSVTAASSGSSSSTPSTQAPPTETSGGTEPKKPDGPKEPDEPEDECDEETVTIDCAVQEVPLPDMPFGP